MFKAYVAYLKDNPHGYWFKRKLYGWGWVPAKWQGWSVTLAYVAILLMLGLSVDEHADASAVAVRLIVPVVILSALLIVICLKTGEKPRLQWGLPKK